MTTYPRCPGCGVICRSFNIEHLDGCPYQGRNALPFPSTTTPATKERLEYLRGEIQAERISYGEIAELQGLAEHIDRSDVELLQWAGVPEFPDDDESEGGITPEGQALGHRYEMGAVNAYCPQCSNEQGVAVLDCDYDLDK